MRKKKSSFLRKWQPTPVFLPEESQRERSLVGCCLWGHTESDTTDATQQQQQQQQALSIRWPKFWIFSFTICPSKEYSVASSKAGIVSFEKVGLLLLLSRFSHV